MRIIVVQETLISSSVLKIKTCCLNAFFWYANQRSLSLSFNKNVLTAIAAKLNFMVSPSRGRLVFEKKEVFKVNSNSPAS